MGRRWVAQIGLLLATLLCGEVAARWYVHHTVGWQQISCSNGWRLRWAAHEIAGYHLQHDPILGIRMPRNFKSRYPIWESQSVHTNSLGARGRVEVGYERTDKRRIVVIGDSYAFGFGVTSDENTYAAILGELLPDTEVVNLAVPSYGTDQMLLSYCEEGARYKPDLLVVGVVGEDAARNILSFYTFAKPMYVLEGQRLVLTHVPVPTFAELRSWEPWRPKLLDLTELVYCAIEERSGAAAERAERITVALWDEIARVAAESHARPLFVYAPSTRELTSDEIPPTGPLLRQFAARQGISALDLTAEFRARTDAGESIGWPHWNDHGHEVVAHGLAEMIERDHLLPSCSR